MRQISHWLFLQWSILQHYHTMLKNNQRQAGNIPNCWKSMATEVLLTGNVGLSGGCNACRSPAPIEKRTWGPPTKKKNIAHTIK